MLKRLTLSLKILSFCYLTIGAAGSAQAQIEVTTALTGPKLKVASEPLGSAYLNSADQTLGGSSCLNSGTPAFISDKSAFISKLQTADLASLQTVYGINLSLSIPIPYTLFGMIPLTTLPILFSVESSALSQTYIYKVDAVFGHANYTVPEDNKPVLNTTGASFWKDYTAANQAPFLNACGDSYISSLRYGASLFIAVQFNFISREDTVSFSKRVLDLPITGLIDFVVSLSAAEKTTKTHGKLTILAVQTGGQPENLAHILRDTSSPSNLKINSPALVNWAAVDSQKSAGVLGSAQSESLSDDCLLKNPAKCIAMLQNISDYVSEDFPTQFVKTSDSGLPVNAAVTELKYLGYEHLLKNFIVPPVVPADIVNTRRQLAERLKANNEFIANIESLHTALAEESFIYASFLKVLEQSSQEHSLHSELIQQAGKICFDAPADCLTTAANVASENLNPLVLPDRLLVAENIPNYFDKHHIPHWWDDTVENTVFARIGDTALITDGQNFLGQSIDFVDPNDYKEYEMTVHFTDDGRKLYMTKWQGGNPLSKVKQKLANYVGERTLLGEYRGTARYYYPALELRNWTAQLIKGDISS